MKSGVLAVALLLSGCFGSVMAQEAKGPEKLRSAILATVRIITGSLENGEFQGQSSGSGVIISPRGYVLTNFHVISDKGKPYPELWAGLVDPRQDYLPPNQALRLKLIGVDVELDLALLKLEPKASKPVSFPFLRLGDSGGLTYGSPLTIVGFPISVGPTTTVTRSVVIGIDVDDGWIKVDGGLLPGISGGAVVNDQAELMGIPTKVQTNQQIPFFGDSDVPLGMMVLSNVGYVRSAEKLAEFLSRAAVTEFPSTTPKLVRVIGKVIDANNRPVSGAVIGILSPATTAPEVYVGRKDLMAYAKSARDGEFQVNRFLRPGKYIFKVVCQGYESVIEELEVTSQNHDFEIKLAPTD
ncbi:MAG TPA: trypsin-like peptidase domain-containing protein [Acidobacteriota bacterium]|nr:trypsin-like peptidase domain-containing protein [Acidobacteriota bacterium]